MGTTLGYRGYIDYIRVIYGNRIKGPYQGSLLNFLDKP